MRRITPVNIYRECRRSLSAIFGENLIFAFVCGSLVNRTYTNDSDIDMLICLNRKSKNKTSIFVQWYKRLHRNYGLRYDKNFTGEVIYKRDLNKKLIIAREASPALIINNADVYDGLVWAGMLAGRYKAFVGSRYEFFKYRRISKTLTRLWKNRLLKKLRLMPPDATLKHITKYSKNE